MTSGCPFYIQYTSKWITPEVYKGNTLRTWRFICSRSTTCWTRFQTPAHASGWPKHTDLIIQKLYLMLHFDHFRWIFGIVEQFCWLWTRPFYAVTRLIDPRKRIYFLIDPVRLSLRKLRVPYHGMIDDGINSHINFIINVQKLSPVIKSDTEWKIDNNSISCWPAADCSLCQLIDNENLIHSM